MSIEENKAIYAALGDAWDRGESGRWGDFITADFVSHAPGREDRDRATMIAAWTAARAPFSEVKMTTPQIAAEGDMLGCRFVYEGTVASTGEKRRWQGFEIARFAGGRIAESWALFGAMSNVTDKPAQPSGHLGETTIEENKAIYLALAAGFDRGEVDSAGEFLAPDFVSHEPGREDWDRETTLRNWAATRSAFSDFAETFPQVATERDLLASRFVIEATGNGRGRVPAGQKGRREGFEIVRFAGGRIAESWALMGRYETVADASGGGE